MIKIAIWYESCLGRNDGNPLYVNTFLRRSQFYMDQLVGNKLNERLLSAFPAGKDDLLAKEFANWFLGEFDDSFKVDHLRPSGNDLKTFGEYDLNIWVDWGEDGLTGVLPYEPIFPKHNVVYWASDTHLGYDYRFMRAKQSDVVFCAQKDAVDSFNKKGVKANWLPHAFEPIAYPKYNLASKKYDVCFIGHVNNDKRMDILDRVFSEFPNFYYGQARFEEASRKFSETKAVINCAMIEDLNMRCFEVMGSGNLLVTDDIPSLHELFVNKKHLVMWKDLDDMIELTRYYIKNPKEAAEIAKNGYEECLAKHTIYHRVKEMFKKSSHLLKEKKHADAA